MNQSDYSVNQTDYSVYSVVNYILSKWKSLLLLSFLFSFFTLLISFSVDDWYLAEARLSAAEIESAPSGSNSFINSLPTGISIGGNLNEAVIEAKEIIDSRDFFKRILAYDGIYEGLLKPYSYEAFRTSSDTPKDITLLKREVDIVMDQNFFNARSIFNNSLDFEDQLESKYYTITFTHRSPSFAKDIVDIIILELNQKKKDRDIEESQKSVSFLKNRLLNETNAEVRGSISRLIESQIKREMIANMRQEYLVSIIDSPTKPISKAGPLRFIIFIISIVISLGILIPIYAFQYLRRQ
tara:strand:- start:319 stop:1209 length:891 start_codon:yes stop_codon:yes gene_type:complete